MLQFLFSPLSATAPSQVPAEWAEKWFAVAVCDATMFNKSYTAWHQEITVYGGLLALLRFISLLDPQNQLKLLIGKVFNIGKM